MNEIVGREVILRTPEMGRVRVEADRPYAVADGETLVFDLYRPPGRSPRRRTPAVVFVTGYSDEGMRRLLGREARRLAYYTSWARLVAGTGSLAVTATVRHPADDAPKLLRHLVERAEELGIDRDRIGLWACSGNVPNALGLLRRESRPAVRAAVLCYGYTLDLDGATEVAEAASAFGFVTPCAGRGIDVLASVPACVVRAGRDETTGLNASLDRFIAAALQRDLPLTLMNLPAAPHAFDLAVADRPSRNAVRTILAFLHAQLHGE